MGNCHHPVTRETVPGSILMGGSDDVESAFRQQIKWSGGGDFVIIRCYGTAAYNPWIYNDLGGVNTVTTIVITNRSGANAPQVVAMLEGAEAIFIAGGDQWQYITNFTGTETQYTLLRARKRVPIGGTSAGCMVLSMWLFTAQFDTVTSPEALSDPMGYKVDLRPGFINATYQVRTLLDTHFVPRDRFGRLLTFVARLLKTRGSPIYGIGVSERSALVVDPSGVATLHGGDDKSAAYVVYGKDQPTTLRKGAPLTMPEQDVQLLLPNETFDFKTMKGGARRRLYSVGAREGVLTKRDPYNP